MDTDEGPTPTARARELFLDDANIRGCAEATFVVLKEAYGLPGADTSGEAMALNGGIAYSGSTCGALTGAALAVGMLAEREIDDHREAKRRAREAIAATIADFRATFGATTCRELTGLDLSTEEGHRAFIEGGTWRIGCMRQIEHVVERLADGDTAITD